MSKLCRLLRSTRAVCRVLRYINCCILIVETCFVVKCAIFAVFLVIPVFLLSLQRKCRRTAEKYSTASRLSRVVDCWLILGVALASFLSTTASFVPPNPHTFLTTPARYLSPKNATWEHTALRARGTFEWHAKKKTRHTEQTAQRQCKFRKHRSLKRSKAH